MITANLVRDALLIQKFAGGAQAVMTADEGTDQAHRRAENKGAGNMCFWIEPIEHPPQGHTAHRAQGDPEQDPDDDADDVDRESHNSPSSVVALATDRYSITSSAAFTRPVGRSRPSVFAVFKLMISSNLVDCTTGRSAGFSPLSTRAV